jgi:hypothetical protein
MTDDMVKIHFRLLPDTDGYPPVAVESVWAQASRDAGEYTLDNIPFFAREATVGDVVRAREEDGQLWFDGVARRSRNSLMRVVFLDRSSLDRVNAELIGLGCATEYAKSHNILAVSIPDDVDLRAIQSYLDAEMQSGVLDYEEPILRQ